MRQRSWEESESAEEVSVLPHVSVRVCTGIYQDGEGTEPFTEPDQDFRRMRQTDVLSEERAGNIRGAEQKASGNREILSHFRTEFRELYRVSMFFAS